MGLANDGYESYYTEKIWQMIPPLYRHEDGLAQNPGVLRELVAIIASQAAHVRRSQDWTWEDQFIELCRDWAVPYIGALVATRMLPASNRRGSRVDVAKTIYYRRRKGTAVILEELIADVTDWPGKLVETFRQLGRSWHRLDPPLSSRGTTLSGTPPGGLADIRRPEASPGMGSPFNEFHCTPDVRRPVGRQGRPNIPTLAFHLYPLEVYELSGVTPRQQGSASRYTFDPSGRDVPLFMPGRQASDWAAWRSPRPWDVPAPLTCTLVNHAEFELDEGKIQQLPTDLALADSHKDELRTLIGRCYRREPDFYRALGDLPSGTEFIKSDVYRSLYTLALADECGRHELIPAAAEVHLATAEPVAPAAVVGGDLSEWSPPAVPDKDIIFDPQRGRFQFLTGTGTSTTHCCYHYGFSLGIGAGGHAREHVEAIEANGSPLSGGGQIFWTDLPNNGVAEISDSATYSPISDKLKVENLRIQASNEARPYCLMTTNWVLNTGSNTDATVALDGLWLGAESDQKLILRGNFETVHLAHMTLDPGGEQTEDDYVDPLIPHIDLSIQGHIETLVIEKSILGRIEIPASGHVEKIMLSDSILQAPSISDRVLDTAGDLFAERVTILGGVSAQHLQVSDSILVGEVTARDPQTGCLRFSAVALSNDLPHPYECFDLPVGMRLFHSTRFGNPAYCRLRSSVDGGIQEGAEDGLEMGAFNRALTPVKLESIKIKVDEYMPFGRLPAFILEV